MKRLFDLFIATLLAIVLFPVFIIISLAIKIDTKGPILFKQTRVGLNGRLFSIYKFRSMLAGADSKGPYYTRSNDDRITKVGAFIRKTSIDELPQVLNVLSGSMSIVGPRPNVLAQKKEYTEMEWNKRNSVKPGITGLAQATLRSAATPEQRTRLDLEYVDTYSFLRDVQIILMTVRCVFAGKGN